MGGERDEWGEELSRVERREGMPVHFFFSFSVPSSPPFIPGGDVRCCEGKTAGEHRQGEAGPGIEKSSLEVIRQPAVLLCSCGRAFGSSVSH